VFQALQIGASGFLLKTAPPGDLVTAARLFLSEATVKTHTSTSWPSWACATGCRR
jgi:DNA-binding NarL/FixJ family response regulator